MQTKEITESQLSFHTFITEKWFRIIEFSLLIGLLNYFKEVTGNVYVFIIYWASWALFFSWFLEMGEFVAELFYKSNKPLHRAAVNLLTTIPFVILYLVVTQVGELISDKI